MQNSQHKFSSERKTLEEEEEETTNLQDFTRNKVNIVAQKLLQILEESALSSKSFTT